MLIDQKIVIIGGTSGIGFAVAEAALDAGAEVVIGSSSQTKIDEALVKFSEKATGLIAQRPNRLAIHRHDYFELYLLEGEGDHFNDFETYVIETVSIVCVSPGQVHFRKRAATLQGPMICFTQEFVEKHARFATCHL
jgi:nucleoside-diphosphate-sugar epimerase